MKNKLKTPELNLPKILSFNDYHEIEYVKDYFNKLIKGKKIKCRELSLLDGEYKAIFYISKNEEYKILCQKHKKAAAIYEKEEFGL